MQLWMMFCTARVCCNASLGFALNQQISTAVREVDPIPDIS
jgi:hypothetical protein